MTDYHLQALSKHPRLCSYLKGGVCVAERRMLTTPVILFQIDDYYVEVFFTADESDVVSTRTFRDVEELEPYLNLIDLEYLLSY